ncbi:hypothetical protein HAZT_HAZT008968 [Hyalella azteca]|uniref:Uncharacterized protein n=1 Tax=Hyalella azteca TaxID=294128 RepID=A0A6A0GUV1_HYAAZ|nr:hypothetical protein HAZT_HAZT008968 [Hyalella azteca]
MCPNDVMERGPLTLAGALLLLLYVARAQEALQGSEAEEVPSEKRPYRLLSFLNANKEVALTYGAINFCKLSTLLAVAKNDLNSGDPVGGLISFLFLTAGPMVRVEGVVGGDVDVPCGVFPNDAKDKVNLILWYKDNNEVPIYSYDTRRAMFPMEKHHLKDGGLRGRVEFTPSPRPPRPHTLKIKG